MYLLGRRAAPRRVRVHAARRPAARRCRTTRASGCCSRSTARTRAGSGRTRRSSHSAPLVVDVDHHHDNTRFGDVNLVVADASSTGEIVRDLLRELDVELTPEIAEALYIALVTDTGRFQYSNTTPKALRLAAELVEAGADVHRVFQGVYETSQFAKLKLLARALERAQIYEGGRARRSRTCCAATSPRSARRSRTRRGSSTTCAPVEGAEMAALIREPPRGDGPARRVCLRASRRRARRLGDRARVGRRAATGRRPASRASDSIEEITEFIRREFAAATAMPPRALSPERASSSSTSRPGRRRSRSSRAAARAGRARGRATRHARPVRDRAAARAARARQLGWRSASSAWTSATSRRSTSRARTSTGDPGGRGRRASTSRRRDDELEARLARLRGEVELPIPAASAVKIGGERAYRLHRRGVEVEMPTAALDASTRSTLLAYDGRRRAARPARQLRHVRPRDRRGARRPLPSAAPHRGRAVRASRRPIRERIIPPERGASRRCD